MNRMKKVVCLLMAVCLLCATAFASGYVHTTGSVNIRKGPGLEYDTRGSVSSGTTLSYQDEYSVDYRGVTWYKVYYNGGTGWISSKYSWLESGGSSGGSSSSSYGTYVRATGTVIVRKGPGTSYDSYNTMSKGEQVEYLNETRYDGSGTAWYKVRYYSYGVGWVSSMYSKLVSGGGTGIAHIETNVSGYYVEATEGKSNLRSQPDLDGKVLCTFPHGAIATYLDEYSYDERDTLWYRVNYDGRVGWVSSRYTTLY